jgi:murein DD-endopeptidase MepM/ murein hydrolase activator NlpD
MDKSGTINASNFFGGDRVEQYRQELVADGKIPGTKENATPEERKEGLKLYRKNKVQFKTFVENVLKKKASAGGGGFDGGMRPTRALLPGTKTASIVKYKSPISKKDLKEPPSKTDVSKGQVEQGFDDILDKIDDLLKEVRDTTKFEKAVADKDRKEKEKKKREEKENRLEGLKNILAGPAQKILAPIKNIFQEIMDAIGKILFAKVGIKLIEWYSNPENAEKLNNVIKFFRRHWLLIVGGLLLFGTRLNGIVMFLLRLGFKFIPKLLKLTFDLIKAAGKLALKMGKGAFKMLSKAGPLARAAIASPAAKIIAVGAGIGGAAVLANEVTGQRKAASVQAGNAARARRGEGLGVQGTDTGIDKIPSPGTIPTTGILQGVRGGGLINSGNRTAGPLVSFNPTFAFSNGGASLGTDTIPAMLSPGEFVMSKGAVQQFGADTFAAMNAAGGGTNRPKLLGGTLYAQGGGYAGGKIKYFSSNGGGNMVLQPGQSYAYSQLRPHHRGSSSKRTDGYPRDYTVLHGTNLQSSPNADIPVPLDSEVIFKGSAGGYGNTVVVKNTTGRMLFGHLSRYGNVNVGAKIKAGTIVGTQGKTGGDYVDHLHIDAEPAGHEAFVNFITSGKPTFGSTSSAGDQETYGVDSVSDAQANAASQQVEQITNPIQYMQDTFKLYQEVFGTTPSDMQKVTATIGVPSPQQSATPNPGVSNDIPKLGSIDPNNRSIIGMKAMHNIVG